MEVTTGVSCQIELTFGFGSRRGVNFVIFGGLAARAVVRRVRYCLYFFFLGWSDVEDPSAGRFLREVASETAVDAASESDSFAEFCEGSGGRRDLTLDPLLSEHGENSSHAHHRQPI